MPLDSDNEARSLQHLAFRLHNLRVIARRSVKGRGWRSERNGWVAMAVPDICALLLD